MKLSELLTKVCGGVEQLANYPHLGDVAVKGLKTNSHACTPGDLFLGMPGTRVDGGDFWPSAIANGALCAIVSPQAILKNPPPPEVLVISHNNMAQICAQVATAFYDYPGEKMKMVGVTGTNGKTTTTHLIEYFLNQANLSTALMGTLYTRWLGIQQTTAYTTPFAVELQQQLATAVDAGCEFGVMEVSSHALVQSRVLGCPFVVAVFCNLTQDHLDYHKDMEDYFAAKALLFSPDYLQGQAIINADDAYGQRLITGLNREKVWSYSVNDNISDFYTSNLNYQPQGVNGILHTPKGNIPFQSPLVGKYNLENLLAAVAVVLHLGLDLSLVAEAIPNFPGVPGRMERVQVTPEQDISVFVDYAHTPDSLENLLKAARPFIPGKMICLVGCGGDRDRTKRPKMGKIAAQLADVAIFTSDNPRTENPDKILEDILAGVPPTIKPIVIGDRATAIRTAILEAEPGDGVLLAGKGHEDYQILGTEKIHFDDREQAYSALQSRLKVMSGG